MRSKDFPDLSQLAIEHELSSEVSKRGWRTEGVAARKSDSNLFSAPLFLCPLMSRRTQFKNVCCILGAAGRQPPPANPFSKPLICFLEFFGQRPGISWQKHPGIFCKKVWFPRASSNIPNFLAPTPSRGRLPPHRNISGPKRLGLRSFFLCDPFR